MQILKPGILWVVGLFLVAMLLLSMSLFIGAAIGMDAVPAVEVLYKAFNAEWLGPARAVVNILVNLCLVLLSCLTLCTPRRMGVSRTEVRAIGSALFCTAAWNVTIMGLVLYGGAWHFASLIFGAVDAIVLLIATVVTYNNAIESYK